MQPTSSPKIIIAGATGHLGGLIANCLLQGGVRVTALVRRGTAPVQAAALKERGADVIEVDYGNEAGLARACEGGSCVVSALSGLREVIVNAQTALLNAAVKAGVPRFIPSDFSIDYTKLPAGSNRNLDLRREFSERLNKAPIKATSILNGMFADLLTGQAPVVLSGLKRVVYWGNADQPMDFTTIADTAAFTAAAALDPSTPRFLRIAGEVASARDLKRIAGEAKGHDFNLFRAGGLGRLQSIIKITRFLFPAKKEVFPAWQGMQYMHNMFTGLPKLTPLDNDRYPNLRWTALKTVLA